VQLNTAHYLQSFAFTNGTVNSLIVFNLHRTSSLPVTFSGANAPQGAVQISQLTSANITDTNEVGKSVKIAATRNIRHSQDLTSGLSLPPYSMTVLTWARIQPRRF
jgi:hypothetical protein